MRWLWSGLAIKVHLVFLTAIVLLTYSVLTGPGEDHPLALAFCACAYPVVLMLIWVNVKINGEASQDDRRTSP